MSAETENLNHDWHELPVKYSINELLSWLESSWSNPSKIKIIYNALKAAKKMEEALTEAKHYMNDTGHDGYYRDMANTALDEWHEKIR